jgi:hypothetical protein
MSACFGKYIFGVISINTYLDQTSFYVDVAIIGINKILCIKKIIFTKVYDSKNL